MKAKLVRIMVAGALLTMVAASSAFADNKTYTFSGTSILACPDFVCTEFAVSVVEVKITGGDWAETPNTRTGANKNGACAYPAAGSVSCTLTDASGIPDASNKATIKIKSTAGKVVGGVAVQCTQYKSVDITGATAAAVVVNFDTKELTPGSNPIGIALVGSLMAILGGMVLIRRRRLTPTLG